MEILMCGCVCLCICRWFSYFSLALVSHLFCSILVCLSVFTSWIPDCCSLMREEGKVWLGERGESRRRGDHNETILPEKKIYFQYKERPLFLICRITFFLKEIWKTQKVKNNQKTIQLYPLPCYGIPLYVNYNSTLFTFQSLLNRCIISTFCILIYYSV